MVSDLASYERFRTGPPAPCLMPQMLSAQEPEEEDNLAEQLPRHGGAVFDSFHSISGAVVRLDYAATTRGLTPADLAPHSQVFYFSQSHNKEWIPAKVVQCNVQNGIIITVDLDIKKRAEVSKISKAQPTAGTHPKDLQLEKIALMPPVPEVPSETSAVKVSSGLGNRSGQDALVLPDLRSHQDVPEKPREIKASEANKVELKKGDYVWYNSTSFNQRMAARVEGTNSNGTYNLDCKKGAQPSRMELMTADEQRYHQEKNAAHLANASFVSNATDLVQDQKPQRGAQQQLQTQFSTSQPPQQKVPPPPPPPPPISTQGASEVDSDLGPVRVRVAAPVSASPPAPPPQRGNGSFTPVLAEASGSHGPSPFIAGSFSPPAPPQVQLPSTSYLPAPTTQVPSTSRNTNGYQDSTPQHQQPSTPICLFMGTGVEGRTRLARHRPSTPTVTPGLQTPNARASPSSSPVSAAQVGFGALSAGESSLEGGELEMNGAFDPTELSLRRQLQEKLGLSDSVNIEEMAGFKGGLNEGIWYMSDTSSGSRQELVLKLVRCHRIASNVLTEAENLLKVQREHHQIEQDPVVAFPVKIFSCVLHGRRKHDLIVMRKVAGMRLAELIALKYYGKEVAHLQQIFEQLGTVLAQFHARYGGAQHGDFQPSNIFYDEATDSLFLIDIGGMGVPTMDNDVQHFHQAMNLLSSAYGQSLHMALVQSFNRGFERGGGRLSS